MHMYFPKPYPDETVYSLLARYQVHAGSVVGEHTWKELFQRRRLTMRMDLPAHLSIIAEWAGMDAQELLQKHTLFPFYAAFMSEARRKSLADEMIHESGNKILYMSGHMAGRFSTHQNFRFCSLCAEKDRVLFGEAYWHRIHQIPGVAVCPIHEVNLGEIQDTKALRSLEEVLHEPINIDPERKSKEVVGVVKDAVSLLEQENRIEMNFRAKCMARVQEMGLATLGTERICEEKLKAFFSMRCHEELFRMVGLQSVADMTRWLKSILHRERGLYHAPRCLVLIRILWGDLASFYQSDATWQPFGKGPWPCLNRMAEHYGQSVILRIKYRNQEPRKAIFRCELCGYTYMKKIDSLTRQNKLCWDEIVGVGGVWRQRVTELIATGEITIKEIAVQLQVHPDTIRKQLLKKTTLKTYPQLMESKRLEDMRQKWLVLLEEYERLGVNALRSKHAALYTWLYRQDKAWLQRHIPRKAATSAIASGKVNWRIRDQLLAGQIKDAIYRELHSKEKPNRITATRMAKLVNAEAIVRIHLSKLPETALLLNSCVETTQVFHVRKLHWAGRVLEGNGIKVTEWNLRKKAAVTRAIGSLEKEAIQAIIQANGGDQDAD